MYWIIDRIEGDLAVLELAPDVTRTLPLSALPPGAREGDVVSVRIDRARTRVRRMRLRRRLRRLAHRQP